VANNPVKFIDPDGRKITYGISCGPNGRDLMTIFITGKVINFSDNNVDMQAAISAMKASIESSFSGQDIQGVDVKVNFDFRIANTMKDVSSDDHLIVLAEANNNRIPGAVNRYGGIVLALDADYFTGLYDTTIGGQGERTVAHEFGHWFNLRHPERGDSDRRLWNLMRGGKSQFRGNLLSEKQFKAIMRRVKTGKGINIGGNTSKTGFPNLLKVKNLFPLTNTRNRGNKQKYIVPNQKL